MIAADAGAVVADGALPVAAGVAALGGLVSFLSPCVLPLVPGFLGYVTGLGGGDLAARRRSHLVLGTLGFIAGFSAVFVPVIVLITSLGSLVETNRGVFLRCAGVVILALAAVFAGFGTQRQAKARWRPAAGLAGAPLLGAAFALGWTPCIGPTLATVIVIARPLGGDPDLVRAVVLGVAYCLGLGLPFLLLAAGWSQAVGTFAWLRSHLHAFQLVGAGLLAVVGLLMVLGVWDSLLTSLQSTIVGWTPVL